MFETIHDPHSTVRRINITGMIWKSTPQMERAVAAIDVARDIIASCPSRRSDAQLPSAGDKSAHAAA